MDFELLGIRLFNHRMEFNIQLIIVWNFIVGLHWKLLLGLLLSGNLSKRGEWRYIPTSQGVGTTFGAGIVANNFNDSLKNFP